MLHSTSWFSVDLAQLEAEEDFMDSDFEAVSDEEGRACHNSMIRTVFTLIFSRNTRADSQAHANRLQGYADENILILTVSSDQ